MSQVGHYAMKDRDTWQTPDWLVEGLNKHQGIDLDACAGLDTDIGDTNWCIERGEDGLEREWHGTTYVNPPFSYKTKWGEKVIEEIENTDCILFLTPNGTDVISWWHGIIAKHADYVWFSEGRLKFIDPDTGEQGTVPTSGHAISIFGEPTDDLLEFFNENGWVVSEVTDHE